MQEPIYMSQYQIYRIIQYCYEFKNTNGSVKGLFCVGCFNEILDVCQGFKWWLEADRLLPAQHLLSVHAYILGHLQVWNGKAEVELWCRESHKLQ